MPKVQPTQESMRYIELARIVKAQMARRGENLDNVMIRTRMPRSTFYSRMKHAKDFRLHELIALVRVLKIPPEDLLGVIYDENTLNEYRKGGASL